MGLYPVLPKDYQKYLSNPTGTFDGLQLIYVKTNIAGFFFDAFLRIKHTSSLTITEHPVETGAAITDHSYINPAVLVMEVGMSDVSASLVNGQFEGGWSRSVTAYQVLLWLQQQRIPFEVVTRLRNYKNMLIETIVAPDDHTTLHGLKATVTLKEVFVATVQTVKVSANPHIADSTPRGEQQPIPVKPGSTLYQALEMFLGHLSQNYNITPK